MDVRVHLSGFKWLRGLADQWCVITVGWQAPENILKIMWQRKGRVRATATWLHHPHAMSLAFSPLIAACPALHFSFIALSFPRLAALSPPRADCRATYRNSTFSLLLSFFNYSCLIPRVPWGKVAWRIGDRNTESQTGGKHSARPTVLRSFAHLPCRKKTSRRFDLSADSAPRKSKGEQSV